MKKSLLFMPSRSVKNGKTKLVDAKNMPQDIKEEFKAHTGRVKANWFNQFMCLCQAIELHGADPMDIIASLCETYKESEKEDKESIQ